MWTVDPGTPHLLGALDTRLKEIGQEISQQLLQLPGPSLARCQSLEREYDEIEQLLKDIWQLETKGHVPTLQPVIDPQSGLVMTDYMVILRGRWQAFFRIAPGGRSLKGIFARDSSKPLSQQLAALLASFP